MRGRGFQTASDAPAQARPNGPCKGRPGVWPNLGRALFLWALAILSTTASAWAQDPPQLLFPVACELGVDCDIQQVVDRDPGPGFRGFDCGPQSYDGHTGTDIRVADLAAMAAGMRVLAAADGVVRALRDGVPDQGTAASAEGQGCGNGIALTHPGGWETQYCHLLAGSLTVETGQTVTAGTPIGLIGYSGRTEFPHLEFVLRHNGQIVDPFDPSDIAQCGLGAAALWAEPVAVAPGGILSAGFSDAVPEFESIRAGTAHSADLSGAGPALVVWAYVHGVRDGDVLRLRIETPSGSEPFHSHDITLERTQAEAFRASGRRLRTPLPPGVYSGEAILIRDGVVLDRQSTQVTLR